MNILHNMSTAWLDRKINTLHRMGKSVQTPTGFEDDISIQ